ncbi:MAG TPA: HAD family acid phosphatase [Pseudolabrys sp.]|nr:HAD family acid phosphatase [Pseudolabrys sp.]
MARIAALIVVALMLATGTARAEPIAATPACQQKHIAPQTLDYSQPLNLGQLKNQIYFYVCSGTYDSELNKIATAARAYVEQRAGEVSKPALVLDIDETSLSNAAVELASDFAYLSGIPCVLDPDSHAGAPALKGPCGFGEWVALARAPAIDGTLALYQAAKQHKVAVFFITGRHEGETAVTEANLKAAGFDHWDGLTLRPEGDKRTVIQYKSGEREKIAQAGFTIIANVGDQYSDLSGGFAERAYKLPNPMYFIP